MLIKIKKNYHLILLGILILIGVFFAFYKFPYRYNLDDEIIRDAVVAIEGARQLQFPLVGSFSSTGPYTFGPWYFYQLIFSNLILQSFYSPWIYLGLAYIVSLAILFWIGRELEGNIFGLILATLGTFSPALIIGATHLTNPNLVTVFALLSVALFIKVVKKNLSYWWTFAFGISLGIAVNIHYQALSLLILPLILLINKKRKVYYIGSFLIGFVIIFIPLILFDLTNHWFNLKNFSYYLLHGKDRVYVPNRWLFYVRDFWPLYWGDVIGVPKILGILFMGFSGLAVAFQIFKKKISTPFLLIAIAFFVDFIAMRYYWGERFFGYFNFLRPFVLIFTGYTFYFIYKNFKYGKLISLSLLIAIVVIILPKSIDRFKIDPFTQDIYKQVGLLKNKYPNNKFSIFVCSKSYYGNDEKLPKSVLFLLEKESRLDEEGVRVGIEKTRCSKKTQDTRNLYLNKLMLTKGHFEEIPSTSLADFSGAKPNELLKAGWKTITFKSIFESTTRWWFKEQP